jgi:hypothetical protein
MLLPARGVERSMPGTSAQASVALSTIVVMNAREVTLPSGWVNKGKKAWSVVAGDIFAA